MRKGERLQSLMQRLLTRYQREGKQQQVELLQQGLAHLRDSGVLQDFAGIRDDFVASAWSEALRKQQEVVSDLERPERFLRILTRPQWKSWLTRGAFVLIGFSAVSGLWWASELGSWLGLYTMPPISSMGLAVLTMPLLVS